MKGLKRLEYRGYDSAGVAFDGDATVAIGDNNFNEIRYPDAPDPTLPLAIVWLSWNLLCCIQCAIMHVQCIATSSTGYMCNWL